MSDIEGLDELNRRLDAIKDARQILGPIAIRAVAYAKETVPRKTGNLGRTIRVGTITETEAQIIAGGSYGVGYARHVEFGTRPHVIVPRTRKVLAWGGDRRLSGSLRSGARAQFFATRVNHPGTRAKPYLRPAAERAAREEGNKAIIVAWNEAA